jgi:hypothetical protein
VVRTAKDIQKDLDRIREECDAIVDDMRGHHAELNCLQNDMTTLVKVMDAGKNISEIQGLQEDRCELEELLRILRMRDCECPGRFIKCLKCRADEIQKKRKEMGIYKESP